LAAIVPPQDVAVTIGVNIAQPATFQSLPVRSEDVRQ
jgi:hypothetical protein